MESLQRMVKHFHLVYNHYMQEIPAMPSVEVCQFRIALIEEEVQELVEAFGDGNLLEVADALADIIYVTLGTAVACGLDMEPIFTEVHNSNMRKTLDKSPAGKTIKGPNWQPPQLGPIIAKMVAEAVQREQAQLNFKLDVHGD